MKCNAQIFFSNWLLKGTLIIFYHSKKIFLIGREPTKWHGLQITAYK